MSEIEKPCPKCGNKETYLRSDGKTMICWRCKHTWILGNYRQEIKNE